MNKALSTLTALLFLIWILPLGAFIKPSQEELACAGQRAICLCSHLMAKAQSKTSGKYSVKNYSGSAQKEQVSYGANHNFLIPQANPQVQLQASNLSNSNQTRYAFRYSRAIDHVPKA